MWTMIFWAVAAAATVGFLYKAWDGFTDSIGAPYTEAQRKADQVKIDEADGKTKVAETERDNARLDTAACVKSSKTQNEAIASADKRAKDAQAATRAIIDAAKRDAKAKQQRIDSLQSIASAKPKVDMTCPEELGKARAILQETLRTRRVAPVPTPPPAVTK